MNEKYRKICRW